MKKIFTHLYLAPLLFQAHPVLAVDPLKGLEQVGTQVYGSPVPTDPKIVIGRIVQVILGFVGIIFLVLIIVGGLQWMTSGGNEKKIEDAKRLIVNATIGLVLIVIAYSIAFAVTRYLTEAVSGSLPAPTGSGGP